MNITFHGTRGSIATPGPETVTYGGDTSCVAISDGDPTRLLILDAGSGIRRLGRLIGTEVTHIDLLLSHLHLDHIIGLGFFAPLFRPDVVLTLVAPPSTTPLLERLARYLSPPLFPVRLRDVTCELRVRDAVATPWRVGDFTISAAPIIHPDSAVGYRIESDQAVVTYMPDHEPALSPSFPRLPSWTSGLDIARDADVLIHDGQYSTDEYPEHVGWGHASVRHAVELAELARVRTVVLFHHDPAHDDADIARLTEQAQAECTSARVIAAREGETITAGG